MEDYLTEQDYKVAAEHGLERILVYRRVYECGWEVERAVTEPVNEQHRATGAWKQWEHIAIVTYQNFRTRLSRGWSEQEAALTPPRKPRGRTVSRDALDMPYLVARQAIGEGVMMDA